MHWNTYHLLRYLPLFRLVWFFITLTCRTYHIKAYYRHFVALAVACFCIPNHTTSRPREDRLEPRKPFMISSMFQKKKIIWNLHVHIGQSSVTLHELTSRILQPVSKPRSESFNVLFNLRSQVCIGSRTHTSRHHFDHWHQG